MTDDLPQTTVVTGRRRRTIDRASFLDITDVDVLDIAPAAGSTQTAVTFAALLTDEQVQQVADRMDSKSAEDEAARCDLRAKRAAVIGDDPVAVAVRASIDYQLGPGAGL